MTNTPNKPDGPVTGTMGGRKDVTNADTQEQARKVPFEMAREMQAAGVIADDKRVSVKLRVDCWDEAGERQKAGTTLQCSAYMARKLYDEGKADRVTEAAPDIVPVGLAPNWSTKVR